MMYIKTKQYNDAGPVMGCNQTWTTHYFKMNGIRYHGNVGRWKQKKMGLLNFDFLGTIVTDDKIIAELDNKCKPYNNKYGVNSHYETGGY